MSGLRAVTTPPSTSRILDALEPDEQTRLTPHLRQCELRHGAVLYDIDDEIEQLYFPLDAMISIVTETLTGQTTEAGVIGAEGLGGVEALLGEPRAVNRHIIQLEGSGYSIKLDAVKEEFARGGAFQGNILRFLRAYLAQVSQTSLCNRVHMAEHRFAKWLLLCHDRSTSDVMPITHEFAAIMLGTNRVSVTLAAQNLQEAGLIEYSRGKLTIVNRQKLETFACECYARISAEYARLSLTRPTR